MRVLIWLITQTKMWPDEWLSNPLLNTLQYVHVPGSSMGTGVPLMLVVAICAKTASQVFVCSVKRFIPNIPYVAIDCHEVYRDLHFIGIQLIFCVAKLQFISLLQCSIYFNCFFLSLIYLLLEHWNLIQVGA